MTNEFDDVVETALRWHREGRGAALATVIETWGSAPRPAGSQMAISGTGEMVGSVSGGCVEGAVVVETQEALEDGGPRILSYGVSDNNAFEVGLACGGTIRILVEPVGSALPEPLLAELAAARRDRRPVVQLVDTVTWQRRLAGADDPELGAAIGERMRRDLSGLEGDVLVVVHNPPLRLVTVGAVHIAQPLVQMARLTGYDVLLIDPREAFATPQRFPGQSISHDYPDVALADRAPDGRTAVVTLAHDPKIDDPALVAALRSPAFYIGCLGSTRTHAKRLERLRAAGFDEAALARLHGPVGLPIGARSPAEIAVSIMAELTQTLRRG